MKKALLGLSLFFSMQASASGDVYSYNYWGYEKIKGYMNEVQSALSSMPSPQDPNKCLSVYNNVLNKGEMDVRYALGYFDDSQGVEVIWNNKNWGLSPSLDIGIYNSLLRYLLEPCSQRPGMMVCGFKRIGRTDQGKATLEKRINLMGRDVNVRLTLTHASASESYEKNKSEYNAEQRFLTQQSEENFFGGVGLADVVIYNGHSRDGGGPDFAPPILNSSLKVDYSGYYQKHRPGIKRVLDLIKANPNKDSILNFFSCYSKKHFYTDILKANPKQKLVLSAETIDYFDTLKASVGYLEGYMRGRCGQDLADVAKQGEKIKAGFQGFQIK